MKVAISVPDAVFEAAEEFASHTGKSRSQLYSEVLTRYLEANNGSVITERLNAVYSQQPPRSRVTERVKPPPPHVIQALDDGLRMAIAL